MKHLDPLVGVDIDFTHAVLDTLNDFRNWNAVRQIFSKMQEQICN